MEMLDVSRIEFVTIDNLTDTQRASVEAFCCDEEDKDIEEYLKSEALDHHMSNVTKTYVAFLGDILIGYFSLAADRVRIESKSKIMSKFKSRDQRINRNSVPGIQIHHFAVNIEYQYMGIGSYLMDNIFFIVANTIYPHIGVCLITVYSLRKSIGFYSKVGFEKIGGQQRDNHNTCMAVYIQELIEQANET